MADVRIVKECFPSSRKEMSNLNQKIFSADDWGFSPGINEGILELARRRKLFSVSASANSSYLQHGLDELLSYQKDGVRFNIHFNLTYGRPVTQVSTLIDKTESFYPFLPFLIRGLAGQFSSAEIKAEFREQIKILRELKIPVTGLDGHHHIHLLPFVFKSIQSDLKANGIKSIRIMRDPKHHPSFFQSLWFKTFTFRNKKNEFEILPCGYLLPEDLMSKDSLKKKIEKFNTVLVHPARFNDFAECGMDDMLQEHRLFELKRIEDYLE